MKFVSQKRAKRMPKADLQKLRDGMPVSDLNDYEGV
ncbi:hypothetical protein OKW39_002379 [Paraburkholderia sp. MM6662-R1]